MSVIWLITKQIDFGNIEGQLGFIIRGKAQPSPLLTLTDILRKSIKAERTGV